MRLRLCVPGLAAPSCWSVSSLLRSGPLRAVGGGSLSPLAWPPSVVVFRSPRRRLHSQCPGCVACPSSPCPCFGFLVVTAAPAGVHEGRPPSVPSLACCCCAGLPQIAVVQPCSSWRASVASGIWSPTNVGRSCWMSSMAQGATGLAPPS